MLPTSAGGRTRDLLVFSLTAHPTEPPRPAKTKGTVVLPLWKSSPLWPVLQPSKNCFTHYVKEFRLLPQYNVIVPGTGNNGIFSKNHLPFKLMAVKIDCTA